MHIPEDARVVKRLPFAPVLISIQPASKHNVVALSEEHLSVLRHFAANVATGATLSSYYQSVPEDRQH
eukprot:2582291-Amphidinium_carterae.1